MKKRFGFIALIVIAVSITMVACSSSPSGDTDTKKETVKVSLFSWPGYGFWFIAKEKNLVPELEIDISIIEDPYESFNLMSSGQLDATSSTVEYGPIAVDKKVPLKFVTYTNPSYGTDRIILSPQIKDPKELKGKKVAVLEGGLTQIYMGIWLEENGVDFKEVEFSNLIMDDAVSAMLSGEVAAGEFWEPFGTQVMDGLKGARVVTTSSEDKWIKSALLGDGMYMSDALLNDRPEVATLLMKAYFDAVAFWKENPKEGNEIIAEGLKFDVADVEKVIGTDGKIYKGGIAVFDLEEAARFMGVAAGDPPLGMKNGQINDHWDLTSDWWIKFGLVETKAKPEAGIALEPLKSLLSAQ